MSRHVELPMRKAWSNRLVPEEKIVCQDVGVTIGNDVVEMHPAIRPVVEELPDDWAHRRQAEAYGLNQ